MKSSVKIPVDLKADEGKKIILGLKDMIKQSILLDAEIDPEVDHCRLITVTDPYDFGTLVPRFDLSYRCRVVDGFHQMSWKGATITYEEATFLYSLVLLMKPLLIMETGMGLALSTFHMAEGLRDNRKGQIFAIELDGALVNRGIEATNHFGMKEFITIVSQESLRFLKEWDRPIDMAVLDTPKAAQEFALVAPHINIGGIVVTRKPVNLPADGFWRRLELPGPTGLFVFQKRANDPEDVVEEPEKGKGKRVAAKKKKANKEFEPEQEF